MKRIMVDYSKIGLKVGLECHQQLATREKLFCSCRPELFKEKPEITFLRRLRPTQSELGQVDPAAFFEFQKGTRIIYEANTETSCLVEMDEEPPHGLNRESLEITLIIAFLMNAKPVDEVHVMRKSVIDGSNTTGFQRTCVVALDGLIEIEGKGIPIQHLSLEEDAARKIGERDFLIRYRIDRLGVPLIEVTTGPVIYSPQEAERVALAIGRILRSTKKVRRGLGTIRQDLNISIRDGALVEIKGVQELELISKVVDHEIERQLKLIEIREELKQRNLLKKDLSSSFCDVTDVFLATKCHIIRKSVDEGKRIISVCLPKFDDLLGRELIPGLRLGTEMSDRAKFWGKVGGVLHTDELASYGVSEQEIVELRTKVAASGEDAVVIVADAEDKCIDALKAVIDRACEALEGVPEETRAANPDGSSRYMRPRPGAARMYPETDVPPIEITSDCLNRLRSNLPEPPEQKAERFGRTYGLNEKLVKQLLESDYESIFELIVKETSVPPTVVTVTLTETLKSLERDGIEVDTLGEEEILGVFKLVDSEKTSKESIPDVITWLVRNRGSSALEAVEKLGLGMVSEEDLRAQIDGLIEKNENLIKE